MKTGIHPNYSKSVVKCACGTTFETRSTKKELHVEICSKCNPFFAGKTKVDARGGRVDRFNQRFAAAVATTANAASEGNAANASNTANSANTGSAASTGNASNTGSDANASK